MRATGGAVAVGARDRLSMIYFGQSRNGLTLGVQLDVGSRIPIATTAMGRAYIWALPARRACRLVARTARSLWQPLAEDARRHRTRRRDGGEARFCNLRRRMAGRRARGRRRAEAERRNRSLRLQLRRAGIPLHGRSTAQRYWTSPCRDGKEHRSGAGWQQRRNPKKKKAKSRNQEGKLHVWPRGSDSLHHRPAKRFATVLARSMHRRARRDDAGTARAGSQCAPARGSRRQRRVRRHHRA